VPFKRYSAHIIQSFWENWSPPAGKEAADWDADINEEADTGQRLSLEAIAEKWGVGSRHTVERWLRPFRLKDSELIRELRRLAGEAIPAVQTPSQELRSLLFSAIHQVTVPPEDTSRVPYHFVLSIVRRLKAQAA